MSFRQALHVVWRKRLLIVAVVLLAVGVAAIFLVRQTPVYTSSISVRMSPLAATASATGQIGTASVDFSTDTITAPVVLNAAAKLVGEPPAASGGWQVEVGTQGGSGGGNGTVSSVALTLTAEGSSAVQAQKRVTAVVDAYDTYLVGQTATARKVAETQVAKSTADAQAAQALVNKSPNDSIAQSSLSAAVAALTSANATITQIDNAGRPIIVSKAAPPGDFQGTSPLIAILVAIVAGLIAGIGIALIWDAFDDRVRSEDDLEQLTGVPALGELALDKIARRGRDRLPAAGRARTALNEGLRSLRTTLQVVLPPGPVAVVITSVEPGEGKTFLSSNLALAWARMGKRVVLIGGDLRNAGLEQYFGEAGTGPGLTELLQEAARTGSSPTPDEIRSALHDTPYPGLSVLPAGDEPWDPADLLALEGVGELMTALRGMSDVIIIDSPPSLALVDARLLAAHADGVVVVASMRGTRRARLVETIDALVSSGVDVLGIAANRSRRPLPKSYSAYYGERRGPLRSPREQQMPEEAPEPEIEDLLDPEEPDEEREPSAGPVADLELDIDEDADAEDDDETADETAEPAGAAAEDEVAATEDDAEAEADVDEDADGRPDASAAASPQTSTRSPRPRRNRRVRTGGRTEGEQA
jgi:polysaccharide biosynthesis transport protein